MKEVWRKWEDNIKKDFKEIRCEGVDWVVVVQERDKKWAVVKTGMNLRIA